MANYPNVFNLLSDIAKKTDTPFILVGGFAVNYYKVSRQTADVDFLITKEGFERILPLLQSEGYAQEYIEENFSKLISKQNSYLMDLDFMFIDKETFKKIQQEAKEAEIAGEKFMVPSLFYLIALKLHAVKYNPKLRLYRDLPDIIDLIRVNKIDVRDGAFKELCEKYGPEGIYEIILDNVG